MHAQFSRSSSASRARRTLTPRLLADAVISTVNLAEVPGKLQSPWVNIRRGMGRCATGLLGEAIHFDEHQARTAGDLLTQTRALWLSLGDRSCLALGMALRAPVYTAEKAWKKIKVGIPIHVIRYTRGRTSCHQILAIGWDSFVLEAFLPPLSSPL